MQAKKINLILKHDCPALLTEDWYSQFALDVHFLMQSLYGGRIPKLALAGDQGQIMSFMTALQREKRYMDSYIKHGLSDPGTLNSRYQLEDAVKHFESETGLRWPFTN